MLQGNMRMRAAAVCVILVACGDRVTAQDPTGDAQAIEGLWSGTWGGGERDGVVFQPARAELLIEGDHVELLGFPDLGRLTGTVRLDARAKRLQIAAAVESDGQLRQNAIEYAYTIKGDMLTLSHGDKVSISLQRRQTAEHPLANAGVEFVAATGINDAGNLLVTEFAVLEAGRARTTHFRPLNRSLSTNQATVLLVQDTGLKNVTVDDARGLIRESTPVVITYRHDDRPLPRQSHGLWKDKGSPQPDSRPVSQTFSRILRPGTLVFVLSARENAPRP